MIQVIMMEDYFNARNVGKYSHGFPIHGVILKLYIPSTIQGTTSLHHTKSAQSTHLAIGPRPIYCSPYTRA